MDGGCLLQQITSLQASGCPRITCASNRATCRFVAFFSVAVVAYLLRTRHGYRCLPEAIHARYGTMAAIAFGLAAAYRSVLVGSILQLHLQHCVSSRVPAANQVPDPQQQYRTCRTLSSPDPVQTTKLSMQAGQETPLHCN